MSVFSRYVNERTGARGDCRIWTAGTSLGRPVSGTPWHGTQDMRKAVVLSTGRVLAQGEVVEPACGNALCLAVAHLHVRRHRRGRPRLGLPPAATTLLERWEQERVEGRLTLARIARDTDVPVSRIKIALKRRRRAQVESTGSKATRVLAR